MKYLKIYSAFVLITLTSILSCKQKTQINPIPEEQEKMYDALRMDTAMHHSGIYHDSVVYAHTHNPTHVHHYDSIYHHHDSLFHHHHNNWHHGDTLHHHTGWHHTPAQHHHHDSLHNVHQTLIH